MRAVDEAVAERLSTWLLDVRTALSEKSNVAERLLDLLGARDAGEAVATAMNAARRIVGERGVSASARLRSATRAAHGIAKAVWTA